MNKYLIILFILFLQACTEPADLIVIPDNPLPPYNGVSQLVIRNFINRAYIDLIGREPLDAELKNDFAYLDNRGLEQTAIDTFLYRLQSDTTFIEGDSSFSHAYAWQVYSRAKVRMINGEADSELAFDIHQLEQKYIKDSLLQDKIGMAFARQEIEKLRQVLQSPQDFRKGRIQIHEIYRRMLMNEIYDEINMGSFNYVNASFDDLFFRFPTKTEFDASFDVIEFNKPAKVLGENCQSKQEYAEILTQSREFYEASIQAEFLTLLGRKASTEEVLGLFSDFYRNQDYQLLQREIMKIPEYGGF